MTPHERNRKSWQLAFRLQTHPGRQVVFALAQQARSRRRPRTLEHAKAKARTMPENVGKDRDSDRADNICFWLDHDGDWRCNWTQPDKPRICRLPKCLAMAGWFRAEPPEHQSGNEASKNKAVDGATQANNISFWLGQSANLRRNLENCAVGSGQPGYWLTHLDPNILATRQLRRAGEKRSLNPPRRNRSPGYPDGLEEFASLQEIFYFS
jgi:hypothetical protein